PAPAKAEKKEEAPKAEEKPAEEVKPVESAPVEEDNKQRTVASPAARKLAREKGIDLSQVPTADPLGRVRSQDVAAFDPNKAKQEASKPAAPKSAPASKPATAAQDNSDKPVERVRMSRRRQTIAKRLVEVQQTSAMLT
ncbi:dihydrolipoamide succinyltransferase, partial [Pseudomonas sp. MPR-R5A]